MRFVLGLLLLVSSVAYSLAPAAQARNVYSSTNVTTAAWVTLIANVGTRPVFGVDVFDSSGQTMKLGYSLDSGATFTTLFISPPGGLAFTEVTIPPGARLSVRAVSATASTGEIDANIYR